MKANLWDEQRQRLLRSYLDGPSDVEGFADDYSFVISGLLDLFGASGEIQWLAFAQQLQRTQDELFWDGTAGRRQRAALLSRCNVHSDGHLSEEGPTTSFALQCLCGPGSLEELSDRVTPGDQVQAPTTRQQAATLPSC